MTWILLALAVMILPLRWILAAGLAATVHECGHYLALRLCGIPVYGLQICPRGCYMQVGEMNRWQTVVCALSGPAAGLFLLLVSRWLPRTAICACIHSAYNLLPVYPLDGGRVLCAMPLSRRCCCFVEMMVLCSVAALGGYGCFVLRLGFLPIYLSIMTIHRALAGKGLAKRGIFRYNMQRQKRMRLHYDRFDPQNPSHGAKTRPLHRW